MTLAVSRRCGRSNDSPISLFSFLDIITSVSGIMIFIVLLLSLEIDDPATAAPLVLEDEGNEVAVELQGLASERKQKRAELRELRKNMLATADRLAELEAQDWENIDELLKNQASEIKEMEAMIIAVQTNLDSDIEQAAASSDATEETSRAVVDLLALRTKMQADLAEQKARTRIDLKIP